MKWFWFKFWFYYRLFMSCLQHFNFCLSIYTNCVYFVLWKSYDLLWFWMHLILCSCFPQLRSENYLLVWCNLIRKSRTEYPGYSYKEIYLKLYGQPGTKSEVALQGIHDKEIQEREEHLSRKSRRQESRRRAMKGEQVSQEELEESSSGSEDELETDAIGSNKKNGYPRIPDPIEEEEIECRKYVYVGTAVEDSNKDLETVDNIEENGDQIPTAPPRKHRNRSAEAQNGHTQLSQAHETTPPLLPGQTEPTSSRSTEETDVVVGSGEESDTNSTSKWIDKVPGVPKVIRNRFHRGDNNRSSSSPPKEPLPPWVKPPDADSITVGKVWNRLRSNFAIPKFRWSASNASQDVAYPEIDTLRPDFTNTYDILDPKRAARREKHDRKALTKKLRQRQKAFLREQARIERNRKKVADSIELVLGLLRMITSFAILIGNIRRTFLLAQINYLRPNQTSLNPLFQIFFLCTTSLDVMMFLMNCMWIWCCQWNVLFCRLGFIRFWCLLLLFSVTSISMLYPMSIAMDEVDLSWCQFKNGSQLAKYQPKWHRT